MEIVLRGKRRRDGVAGRRERRVHGVADRLEDRAAVLLDRLAQDGVMLADGAAISLGMALLEPRRPLDVREQERDRSRWQGGHGRLRRLAAWLLHAEVRFGR